MNSTRLECEASPNVLAARSYLLYVKHTVFPFSRALLYVSASRKSSKKLYSDDDVEHIKNFLCLPLTRTRHAVTRRPDGFGAQCSRRTRFRLHLPKPSHIADSVPPWASRLQCEGFPSKSRRASSDSAGQQTARSRADGRPARDVTDNESTTPRSPAMQRSSLQRLH